MVESSFDNASYSSNNVVEALQRTSKGQLKYDTDWKEQGRTREIVESVKKKVSALSVTPKSVNQARSLAVTNLKSNSNDNNSSKLTSIFDIYYGDEKSNQIDLILTNHDLEVYEQRRKESVEKRLEPFLRRSLQEKEQLRHLQENEHKKIERNGLLAKTKFERRLSEMDQSLTQLANESAYSNANNSSNTIDLKLKEVQEKTQLMQKQEALRLQEQEEYRRKVSDYRQKIEQCLTEFQIVYQRFIGMTGNQEVAKMIAANEADFKHFQNTISSLGQELELLLLTKPTLSEEDVESSRRYFEEAITLSKSVQDRLAFLLLSLEAIQSNQTTTPTASAATTTTAASAAGGDDKSKKSVPFPKQPDQVQVNTTPTPATVPSVTVQSKSLKSPTKSTYASPGSRYLAYKQELTEFEKLCQNFTKLPNAEDKKRRTDLQLFVRSTINVICSASIEHLKDQLRKLLSLLNGQTVMRDNKKIKCMKSDYSFHFVVNNAAKHFVDVCTKMKNVSFQLAPVITILWTLHPQFGRIFMCHLTMACPYVIPYFPVLEAGQSEKDYLQTLGYRMLKTGGAEPEESFTERVTACIELYAMVIQCNMEKGEERHPQDMQHAWRWLAEVLNGDVAPEMTALLLSSFLTIAAPKMSLVYGKQFRKMLTFIKITFVKKIEAETDVKQRASLMKLKSILEEVEKKLARGTLKLEGLVPDYFFQKRFFSNGAND